MTIGGGNPLSPLICIVGPTAVGKTALAVELASQFGGEIVNADSRQVYRHMTIGTAKPTREELDKARHHLIDIIDPPQPFGLARFLANAKDALRCIRRRAKLPIVCGGTGQYVWGLASEQSIPAVSPDLEFRAELESVAESAGPEELHRRLFAVDPVRAAALDMRNVRRVIRALEIFHVAGIRPSDYAGGSPELGPGTLVIGLTMQRQTLYNRIDDRVDRMMSDGFLDEVRSLSKMGYPMGEGPLASPGYRELGRYVEGSMSLDEAVARTKSQTHRLARRQYTWFKPGDPRVVWLEATDPQRSEVAAELVAKHVGNL